MRDVTVVGGGIVGLATAYTLLESGKASVRLLEKEVAVARHQSTHNSGVLHAGLQYQPGSEKARLARDGIRRMTEFCAHHRIPHEICGKLVVAVTEAELPRLDAMLERGRQNGLQGLRRLGPEEAREIEPHARCMAAIHVPEEGIVDYAAVCAALEREIEARGGEILLGAGVRGLRRERGEWQVETPAGVFTSRVLVNCAGLYADRIAVMAGERPGCRIVPFRGEYQRLRPGREHLVRHLLYPLPEPGFPFLGVHFTRRIEGGIDAGPNAVLAFAREGYDLTTVDLGDLADALAFPGLWRFAFHHTRMVARELAQSLDPRRFIAAARRLIPEINDDDFIPGGASGVRAQAMLPDGRLLDDFRWVEAEGAVHVVNAPSPAATASLAIAQEVARRALSRLAEAA
jgi:(S)-2-hydroxyglutarate dehydrogenase